MTERPTISDSPDARTAQLTELRNRIDTIDATVHDLLIERSSIIDALIEVKQAAKSGVAFRPGREAAMMRRFAGRHHGTLPLVTVEHLWREIISTFTYLQAPYRLHVAADGRAEAMRDAARFYFGFSVPAEFHDTADAAVAAVRDSRSDLALLPLGVTEKAWWSTLDLENAPRIIARVPFLTAPDRVAGEPAVIVSNPLDDPVVPEIDCFAVDAAEAASLTIAGLDVLASCASSGETLIAMPAQGDRETEVPAGLRPVGGYARPLAIGDGTIG